MGQAPPRNAPEYAVECLRALAAEGLGALISVGGGVGLLHYLDYRPTHDLDLWWAPAATSEDRRRVLSVAEGALKRHGVVRRRQWGDVVSLELVQDSRGVFSVQIAERDAALESPRSLDWVNVMGDGINDLIASKMNALMQRGAPRDFRDIRALCAKGMVRPGQCWDLWRRRLQASGTVPDMDKAVLAVRTHLERIETARPLEQIADEAQRDEAQELRAWFAGDFLAASAGGAV